MLRSDNLRIQIRVSNIIAGVGLLVVIVDVLRNLFIRGLSFLEILQYRHTVLLVFSFSLLMFLLRKSRKGYVKYIQIAVFLANAALAILDEYDTFHGIGFIILTILLAYRYGILDRFPRVKLILVALFLMFFMELSISLTGEDQVGSSLDIVFYLVFFLSIIYLIYKSEIDKLLRVEKVFNETIASMKQEKASLEQEIAEHSNEIQKREIRIQELEVEISKSEHIGEPLKLKEDFGITRREEEVLREFCLNPQMTTKELAEKMFMSLGTIKQHFNSIFRKLKVRNRSELLNMCKWNFSDE